MYGLIDCNNFFVSCERVFRPELTGRPVIVLSNNDGCAVAMSNEAKTLGIRRGVPYYQIRSIAEANHVAVFSGNHRLYGDMSSRVMATLSSLVPDIEIYSIDEAFLHMHNIEHDRLEDEGREIVRRIRRDVGIPTSLGIASTKTLAKIAARFAKRYPAYRSVCIIDNEDKRRKALELSAISDVWGIGRRLGKRLLNVGISTALQFADLPLEQVRRLVNITGERTWRELNGEPCIGVDVQDTDRKQLCVSRSFARSMTSVTQLREAVSTFTETAARKLRRQNGRAVAITTFIHTNAFRDDQEQYYSSATRTLEEPSADTLILINEALAALNSIFRSGYYYKKAGVIINEIVSAESAQHSLFVSKEERDRRKRLMSVIDGINANEQTHDTVHMATIDHKCPLMRRDHISPLYSTRMSDIITVKTHISDKNAF